MKCARFSAVLACVAFTSRSRLFFIFFFFCYFKDDLGFKSALSEGGLTYIKVRSRAILHFMCFFFLFFIISSINSVQNVGLEIFLQNLNSISIPDISGKTGLFVLLHVILKLLLTLDR
jgi:hypothetical protein